MTCPLCTIRGRETILHDAGEYIIVRCRDAKGHHNRIMLVHERHGPIPQTTQDFLHSEFSKYCRAWFTSPTVAILHDLYSSVPEHYHIVASDWEGDDIDQMHRTPLVNIETLVGKATRGKDL